MSMSAGGNEGGPMSEINVTPLVDVMLVLLIIFMITAPLMSQKVKVDLPIVTSEADKSELKQVNVAVRNTGELFWNDKPISRESLLAKLRIEARRAVQPDLKIRGDATTEYRIIKPIIIDAKVAGMKKIQFVTHPQR